MQLCAAQTQCMNDNLEHKIDKLKRELDQFKRLATQELQQSAHSVWAVKQRVAALEKEMEEMKERK